MDDASYVLLHKSRKQPLHMRWLLSTKFLTQLRKNDISLKVLSLNE